MKAKILGIDGKERGTIDLPKCFSQEIREDIIARVLESKKNKQPYAPNLLAGKQYSASGKIIHRRHVWKSQYGRGMSRIPRKTLSKRGSQFRWEGATVPNTKGGRRAHPPKTISMINTKKINKKEMKRALVSAISATAEEKKVTERYGRLKGIKIKNLPLIAESKLVSLKTKNLISAVRNILGKELSELAIKKKSVRSGRGKLRGRRYKKNAGLLLVIGKDERIKTDAFDVVKTEKLSVNDLARGGSGRLAIYTEEAIKSLGEKFK